MKYLVTGGAGFIGSHLVDKLLLIGQVIVIDDFSMGKMENLTQSLNLAIAEHTILSEYHVLEHLFEGVDTVFHLAALTRPRESFDNSFETREVNVTGTQQILNIAQRAKVRKFVFISSATVYGNQSELPIKEDAQTKPESPYGDSKLEAEKWVQGFCEVHDIQYNIIRPFNVYGTRQDPKGEYGAAIPKFIDSLKSGKQPYITGDGEQFRDFIHIDDLTELLVVASISEVNGEIFNGGSGKKYTVNQIYKAISALLEKTETPVKKPEIKEPNTLADISKAEEMLGWKPNVNLREGLRLII